MSEYIERQDAIDAVYKRMSGEHWEDIIRSLPPADVKPVVRGRWVRNNGIWCCDKCTCQAVVIRSPFCPHCGADMRGGMKNDEKRKGDAE